MTNAEIRREVKACIRFYERRGLDWTTVVEFILVKHSGNLERILTWRPWQAKKGSTR